MDRPILFSRSMVLAILAGQKTQTRRTVRMTDLEYIGPRDCEDDPASWGWEDEYGDFHTLSRDASDGIPIPCPYGVPGDRLWVREEHYRYGHWEPILGVTTKTGRQKWRFMADSDVILYDPPKTYRKGMHARDPSASCWHKRLARFMPRSASRITLEVTSIRVERLQTISEEDARAEGVPPNWGNDLTGWVPEEHGYLTVAGLRHGTERPGEDCDEDGTVPGTGKPAYVFTAREAFRSLWDSINGDRAPWASNPWVWRVGVRRVAEVV
jgi:hypothetical protein